MTKSAPDAAQVTGRSESHLLADSELGCSLHREVIEPLRELRQAARAEGFELAIASSFRSFERQCLIWNEKLAGRRPVLNDADEPIDLRALDEWQQLQAVLRWSALPGASRHHWGTDFDVFDRAALSEHYPRPQLTAAESAPGGPFHAFHCWLNEALQSQFADFFRPYAVDCGGVGCEPWHLSYRPVASRFEQALSPACLEDCLRQSSIAKRDTVLQHLDDIYSRYVINVAH